jgi:ribosomal protein L11 methylase PrmA
LSLIKSFPSTDHRPGNLCLAGSQCGCRTNRSSCMEFMYSMDSTLGFPCDYMDRNFLTGKTVMELGCGTGLASIAASPLGAARVLATDGNPDVVELARQNAHQNQVDNVELKMVPPPLDNLSQTLLDTISPQEHSVLDTTGGVRVVLLFKPKL